jgi:AraC-like DNA-binding protein
MVCPRCIDTVRDILIALNIDFTIIELGKVISTNDISQLQKSQLEEKLIGNGFELLEDKRSKLISQVKAIIVNQIHHEKTDLKINFSTLISEKTNHEYSSLSRLFSSVEGITIERFILKQKIERVKELIFYNEMTFSEIAAKMDYSSVAYLSAQFKKETGLTPTEFKSQKVNSRKSIDAL